MKRIFQIINILLITLAAYFCVDMVYKKITATPLVFIGNTVKSDLGNGAIQAGKNNFKHRNAYGKINNRNLFRVLVRGDAKPVPSQPAAQLESILPVKATGLEVKLWGTVTGPGEKYAVIEDKKTREQSLVEQGDTVQGAVIKEILRNKVILTLNGLDQLLEVEIEKENNPKRTPFGLGLKPREASVDPLALDHALQDMNAMMQQIKMRPYFSDGEPDGLMVYGIKPKSVFKKVGLRNGDIIKEVNGDEVVRAQDAQALYTELKESDNVRVTLMRRGEKKELIYHSKNGTYTITTYPD